jgi:hypothetical protein
VAWHQALGCFLAIAVSVAIFVIEQRRPAGPDEVKIYTAQLRSQAAELRLLTEQAVKLPRPFISAHAVQLGETVDSAYDELATLRIEDSDLDASRREAREHGRALRQAVHNFDATNADRDESLAERQRALEALERRLQR